MKHQPRSYWRMCLLLLCLTIVGPLLVACGQSQARRPPLKVVATITPLGDWARQVGGDLVEVKQLVPAGVDPKTYTPSESDYEAITKADVLLSNGYGLEPWLQEAQTKVTRVPLIALELAQYLGIRTGGTHTIVRTPLEAEDDSKKSEIERVYVPPSVVSPYVWLDPGPGMAQQAVWLIADTFTRADINNLLTYRHNADQYVGQLENLDNWIKSQIRTWPRVKVGSKDLLAMQDIDRSWHYFAQHYTINLRTTTTVNAFEPTIPSAAPLFVSRYLDESERLRLLGLRNPDGQLDPFANDSYIELMKHNVNLLTQGMQRAARNEPQQFKIGITGS